ncbi:hypothetical protein HanXRQr2_Chr09g0372441 [Helianthus annuus]|uniref:Uncharacterized protein n=1 Tax=Helianthus annuus TaxID=4232 RepID=A0A251TTA9_HELAN|nr:hypothetical protein HanXRQr2_Chr09g0372441 [Helianthus annuus]KAJ0532870.1 hypothetical protein HanIR_Chr09g0401821 [Helianthus annuus]
MGSLLTNYTYDFFYFVILCKDIKSMLSGTHTLKLLTTPDNASLEEGARGHVRST